MQQYIPYEYKEICNVHKEEPLPFELPAGYTRLKGIEPKLSTTDFKIDTGVKPALSLRIEAEVTLTDRTVLGNALFASNFGHYNSGNMLINTQYTHGVFVGEDGQSLKGQTNGGSIGNVAGVQIGKHLKIVLDFKNKSFSVNGVTTGVSIPANNVGFLYSPSIALFAQRYARQYTNQSIPFQQGHNQYNYFILHSFITYTNDEVKNYFVPVKDSSGQIGLYNPYASKNNFVSYPECRGVSF